ncbi:MAG TPA: hypothetical protein VHX68_08525 [Planctomycetaceae bacterium]|nr:hypothetical protein [Planctomycetaceae bacterium]
MSYAVADWIQVACLLLAAIAFFWWIGAPPRWARARRERWRRWFNHHDEDA